MHYFPCGCHQETSGRGWFSLASGHCGDEGPVTGDAMTAGRCSWKAAHPHILSEQEAEARQGVRGGYQLQVPVTHFGQPSSISQGSTTSSQSHLLATKCSNMWACGEIVHIQPEDIPSGGHHLSQPIQCFLPPFEKCLYLMIFNFFKKISFNYM